MQSQQYTITPFTITKSTTISSMSLNLLNLKLNESATFDVSLYDSSGNFYSAQPITLNNNEYNGWASNDNYVIETIATIIGSSYTPS